MPAKYAQLFKPSDDPQAFFPNELLEMKHFSYPHTRLWFPEALHPRYYKSARPPCKWHGEKPNFTYKTASLLQDAHKTLQKRSRRDTTILQYASEIDDLRVLHTAAPNNQHFTNQFVDSERPSRARPIQQVLENRTQNHSTNADSDDELDIGDTLESPAELERRVYAYSGRKRRRKNAKPRCRRCGKHWNTDEWRDLHRREPTELSEFESNDDRPQNRYLRHGQGKQVWDHCKVNECDYEPGFPCIDKPMPRAK